MAWRRAMACTPMASVIVMTAGRPSGMAATARPTTAMNISENGDDRRSSRRPAAGRREQDQDREPAGEVVHLRHQRCRQLSPPARAGPRCARSRSRAPWRPPTRRAARDQRARRPSIARSPRGAAASTGSAVFSTGTDSPVRIASSRRSPAGLEKPQVGGHLVAGLQQHDVAGHKLGTIHIASRPSRSTAARGASILRIAAIAASALPSCTKPITALARTTARITPVSTQCWRPAVTAAPPEAHRSEHC